MTAWWREPTRAQWMSFFAAWSGWVLDAFDFTIFMLVMPSIAKEFGVETIATTGSIALTLIARLFGGFIAGAAADRWGRKLPLLISIVWFALCDGAVALAPSFTAILVLRTLFGIGMGAEWTSGTTLAMENWPARSKGIASGILQGSWAIGYLAAALVSGVVVPAWGWRGMFVLAALPALLVLPMRAWIPESTDWEKDRPAENAPIGALFQRGVVGRLVWACGAMALGLGAYYSLTGLYPTALLSELHQTQGDVAVLVAVFNVGMLIGSIAWGAIAARFGATLAICLPALLAVPLLPLYVGISPSLMVVGAFAMGALGVGFCGVVPLLLTSLSDVGIRARFVGVVYHAGALFAAFVPMGIAALAKYASISIATSIGLVAAGFECVLAVIILGRSIAVSRSARITTRRTAVAALSILGLFGLLGLVGCERPAEIRVQSTARGLDMLETVANFGSNPGNLTMHRYVPSAMPQNAPVVVALHGCTQSAADFTGSGLDQLADQYKFYVVYPQQETANNPVQCFDWFGQYNHPDNKANITRGMGENTSIKEMVDKMATDFSIDQSRVYVLGFSSGGAMAAVMLAAWPDVFAAGAINSGVPYDCPSTQNADVWQCQNPGKVLDAGDWSMRVKNADPGYSGSYPRVSIWHGTSDYIVASANETELVKQWTDVHGISATPTAMDMVDGFPHATYADGNGNVLVESYQISGMGHGMAVDPSHGCGAASQYFPDEHTCTAAHMIAFFGLTTTVVTNPDAGPNPDATEPAPDSGTPANPDASMMPAPDAAVPAADAGAPSADSGTPPPPAHDAGPSHDSGPQRGGGHADAGISAPHSNGDAGASENKAAAADGSAIAGCNASGHRARGTGLPALTLIFILGTLAWRRRSSN